MHLLVTIYYRASQFFRGFFAKITPEEEDEVRRRLSASEYALFERMPLDARRHSINVYQTLTAIGKDNSDLMVAALLHDVGKVAADESGTRLGLWMRIPLVIVEAVWPEVLLRFSSTDLNNGWHYALYVHLAHPQIGAAWAKEANCSRAICWLIAAHQDKHAVPASDIPCTADLRLLLADLQWADNRN